MTTVGQFTVDRHAALRRAAATVRPASRAGGIVPELRLARVTSNDGGSPPTCTITTLGSATVEAGIRYAAGQNPQAADLVYVVCLAGDKWVLCLLAPGPGPTSADATGSVSTTSASYTTLSGGPVVGPLTLAAGHLYLVTVSARLSNDLGPGHGAVMSFAVSGADTLAASDVNGVENDGADSQTSQRTTLYVPATGGDHTFTANYKAINTPTATFVYRRIIVAPA